MAGVLGNNVVVQIAFVVNDVEKTRREFERFLGVPSTEPALAGECEIIQTQYMGKPAPRANCTMSFIHAGGNVMIELIQPNDEPSTWRDALNEKGEGFHHIAFSVPDTDAALARCADFGMTLPQRGISGAGSGQYASLDATAQLKSYIELLESFSR